MNHRILKYPLNPPGVPTFLMLPAEARPLDVQIQGDKLTMWALVPDTASDRRRKFMVYGTGWDILTSDMLAFIATIQHDGLVWHAFEEQQQ